MNFKLAREIYGMNPFCVDSQTLPAMMSVLDDIKNGITYTGENLKNSLTQVISLNSETKYINRPYQLDTNEEFEGVAIINIDGPILLSSGASTIGMKQVSRTMKQMAADKRIKGFIMVDDSGGGSTAAVELMVDTINEIRSNGKPVYTLIDVGGTLASAAYGIASASDKIYYQSDMSIVGSLGTMLQTQGRAANVESEGVKYIRLYATKSVQKNADIEEALNNDNYQLLINDILDPINERFLEMLKKNRPSLNEDNLNGSIAFAKDSEGVYVDGKSDILSITKEILAQANTFNSESSSFPSSRKKNKFTNRNINLNPSSMTRSELQAEHPDLYNEVFGAGVTAESERVKSWLAHSETDSKAVLEGINSGAEITPSKREEFLVKAHKSSALKQIQGDNADDFTTPESTITADEESKKGKELEQAFKFDLK